MKKDINIHIKEIWHKNIDEDAELLEAFCDAELPDDLTELLSAEAPPPGTPQIEFSTCGTYEESTDGISITYEESELTGMKGAVTSFFISKSGCITMLRTGKNSVNLTFEAGKNYICHNGNEPFLVTTRNLKNSISENGGSLDISYTINVDGVMTEHNEFNIDIAPPAFPYLLPLSAKNGDKNEFIQKNHFHSSFTFITRNKHFSRRCRTAPITDYK